MPSSRCAHSPPGPDLQVLLRALSLYGCGIRPLNPGCGDEAARVLLVDDNTELALTLAEALQAQHAAVDSVPDGAYEP